MKKFEYITCNRNYGDESEQEFVDRINKLGEMGWEAVCPVSCLLHNFEEILLKRERRWGR